MTKSSEGQNVNFKVYLNLNPFFLSIRTDPFQVGVTHTNERYSISAVEEEVARHLQFMGSSRHSTGCMIYDSRRCSLRIIMLQTEASFALVADTALVLHKLSISCRDD